eukprot:1963507-Rhodomonas_salina.1
MLLNVMKRNTPTAASCRITGCAHTNGCRSFGSSFHSSHANTACAKFKLQTRRERQRWERGGFKLVLVSEHRKEGRPVSEMAWWEHRKARGSVLELVSREHAATGWGLR